MRAHRGYIPLIVLIIVGGFAAAIFAYFSLSFWYAKHGLDAVPLAPTNYQPAALELVQVCQSNPEFFSREATRPNSPFDPAYAPPSVAKLHPETVDFDPDGARVIWGGGFYHCEWRLKKTSPTADGRGNTWTLSFHNEDGVDKVLETIDVPSDFKLTDEQCIGQFLAEIDRRLAAHVDDGSYSEPEWCPASERYLFLQTHHRVDLLPAEVSKAASYPHDWRDVLMKYLMEARRGHSNATTSLQKWADATTGPAAWMYAAYAFYEAGDATAGDDALKRAAAKPLPDPEWMDKNIPQYELAMAVRLYRSKRFAESAKLCDAMLAVPTRYFITQSAVQRFRDQAKAAVNAPPAEVPEFDKFTVSDPFGGLDLQAALAEVKPATPQPNY